MATMIDFKYVGDLLPVMYICMKIKAGMVTPDKEQTWNFRAP